MFVAAICSYLDALSVPFLRRSSEGPSCPTNEDDGGRPPGGRTKTLPFHHINTRLTSKAVATTLVVPSTYYAPWYTTSFIDDMVPSVSILQGLLAWNRVGVGDVVDLLDGACPYSPSNDGYDDARGELGQIEVMLVDEGEVLEERVAVGHHEAVKLRVEMFDESGQLDDEDDTPITCHRISRLGIMYFDEQRHFAERDIILKPVVARPCNGKVVRTTAFLRRAAVSDVVSPSTSTSSDGFSVGSI